MIANLKIYYIEERAIICAKRDPKAISAILDGHPSTPCPPFLEEGGLPDDFQWLHSFQELFEMMDYPLSAGEIRLLRLESYNKIVHVWWETCEGGLNLSECGREMGSFSRETFHVFGSVCDYLYVLD